MANYLDSAGLVALWAKIKQRISDGVGDIDLSPYLKTENLATINGEKLSEGGNITIDLTLFKVVDSLPTTGIDENKIYLVKSAETETGNIYTEYVYANKAWEKLGEYKSEVDLTPYAKTADVNTSLATKVDKVTGKGLSTNDFTDALKTKLEGIESGADKYELPIATTTTLGGIKTVGGNTVTEQSVTAGVQTDNDGKATVSLNAASASYAGVMTAADKKKLDGIADGANTYELPVASDSVLGGVKVGKYIAATETTCVVTPDIDSEGNITVNIPLAQGTSGVLQSSDHAGLMSADDKRKLSLLNNFTLHVASNAELGGIKLPMLSQLEGEYAEFNVNSTTSDGIASVAITYATTAAAGLMSAADKTKLDGIEEGANNYTHPTSAAGAKASGLYKITTDANGHVTAASAVAKADITALGIPAQDTTYSAMTGATASAAGKTGLVPAPAAGKQAAFLRGDGTWVVPTDTTYNDVTTTTHGLMTAADKVKLNGIATSATADAAIPISEIEALS